MVRTLRAELGTEHGTVQQVARQLGYGIESVRWLNPPAHVGHSEVDPHALSGYLG